MTGSRRNEELLVLMAQLGDIDALQQLLQALTPRISRCVRMIVHESGDVEDAMQESLLIVWRKLQWLKEPAYLNGWVHRIASREALRVATKRSRRGDVQLDESEWAQLRERASPRNEAAKGPELLDSVSGLPPASRAVLTLHYLEDLTIEEAAEQLNIPVGTAKSRLSFGIQKLRAQLRGLREKEIE